jgi:hypothetical protein
MKTVVSHFGYSDRRRAPAADARKTDATDDAGSLSPDKTAAIL